MIRVNASHNHSTHLFLIYSLSATFISFFSHYYAAKPSFLIVLLKFNHLSNH